MKKKHNLNIDLLKGICLESQYNLLNDIEFFLQNFGYKKIIKTKEYIMAAGEVPVCLMAHLDTINEDYQDCEADIVLYDKKEGIVAALGGRTLDDRLGVFCIIEIISKGYKPSVIFCTGEEVGGLGAQAIVKANPEWPLGKTNFIIELDRKNYKDAVFYSCGNRLFKNLICDFGFEEAKGTFSDCIIIGEAYNIAAVNLSISYYNEHTAYEYAYIEDTYDTIFKVEKILKSQSKIDYTFPYDKLVQPNSSFFDFYKN